MSSSGSAPSEDKPRSVGSRTLLCGHVVKAHLVESYLMGNLMIALLISSIKMKKIEFFFHWTSPI